MSGVARSGEDRIVTLPTAVTVVRLACIPVFVALAATDGHRHWIAAAILLGVVGATDWVDGQLARRLHQVSTLGKILDPLADRLLLVVGFLTIIAVGAVPVWVAVVFLAREVLVAAGFLIVFARGGRRMDVEWVGKAATFALMFALPFFLWGHATESWHEVPEALAWVATAPAIGFGWYSVITYIPKARRVVAEAAAATDGAAGGTDSAPPGVPPG